MDPENSPQNDNKKAVGVGLRIGVIAFGFVLLVIVIGWIYTAVLHH